MRILTSRQAGSEAVLTAGPVLHVKAMAVVAWCGGQAECAPTRGTPPCSVRPGASATLECAPHLDSARQWASVGSFTVHNLIIKTLQAQCLWMIRANTLASVLCVRAQLVGLAMVEHRCSAAGSLTIKQHTFSTCHTQEEGVLLPCLAAHCGDSLAAARRCEWLLHLGSLAVKEGRMHPDFLAFCQQPVPTRRSTFRTRIHLA